MLRSYIRSAWRSCRSNPGYTSLNVIGLAIGMTVSLVIGLWAYYQYSYDKFIPNYQHISQLKINFFSNGGKLDNMAYVSIPLAEAMKKDIPGVEKVALADPFSPRGLSVGDKKMIMTGAATEPAFLDIFKYPVISGGKGMLDDPNSIVLTESAAKALFGNEDPINKTVKLENELELRVTGVLADIPGNSSIQFQFLFPFRAWELHNEWIQKARSAWSNNSFFCFMQLTPGADFKAITGKADAILKTAMGDGHLMTMIHPLSQWHLYDRITNGKVDGGFISYVRMFMVIGLLILIIACINFVNLSTAQADKRAKEVGVRKAIGSSRRELILQFLVQSCFLVVLATALSLILLVITLPYFNALAGSTIAIPYTKPAAWVVLIGFILLVTLLAGSRPAFLLSGFKPIIVLKGFKQRTGSGTLMKVMVVSQFAASIALIIATVIIYQQIQYGKSRPTGYNISGLVMTDMTPDLARNFKALKNDLLASGAVTSVTAATSPVTNIWSHSTINDWPGKTEVGGNSYINAARIAARDDDYFTTTGMQILEGRNFNKTVDADSGVIILNEAAVKQMGLKNPVGQTITWAGDNRGVVVGVVKDALMISPFTPAEPTIFHHSEKNGSIIYRLSSNMPSQAALDKIGRIFSLYNPSYPYQYAFADADYEKKFRMEVLTGKLAGLFAGLAILVSCLGLLGLAAYTAANRTKEIAVRRVMGASTTHLWLLLTKQFVLLVLLGGAVAIPMAWLGLNSWLEKYDYRIGLSPIVFIGAIVLSLFLTLLTVSYQALKAASINPVDSLKSE
ncbi:MacB-like core domain-containing protein [Chitinophaga terrae (ex Kim and Jung 2007)]|uniref:MacB-like core domain-containing protein n=1 Tax=Chitinophaga terrae (ex Kim and Jung 2007) TaxID=408074 RepID=A0A1H4A397_9BACT|nr:ABC transporter permease [Chitinophaga terrae (ex Kim and Jung 2007)]GEP90023.1 ABC transporter permease [Chitinophaga terrae (ex Kim and Jung 2007)]SEA30377.1 MacB-like core domain-containing protein [Chitinophaga terrae (ex Kim and Jung 2007)]